MEKVSSWFAAGTLNHQGCLFTIELSESSSSEMPLVKGDEDSTDADWEDIHNTRTGRAPEPRTHRLPEGRIKNTRKLLRTAALIMSAFLITSSLVTTMLIPADKFQVGG